MSVRQDLVIAVRVDDVETVRYLLAGNPDLINKSIGLAGYTVLHIAAVHGSEEVAQILLAHHADPQLRTDLGNTPLMLAAMNGYVKVARSILENTPIAVRDIGEKDATALHYAATFRHVSMIELLLEWDADINATDATGKSPADCTNDEALIEKIQNYYVPSKLMI